MLDLDASGFLGLRETSIAAGRIVVLVFIFATFLLAGFVKGVIGLGLPTVSVGLLTTVISPAEGAAILMVPSLVTNIWQAAGPRLVAIFRRLWTMMVGISIGTYAAAGLLTGGPGGHAATALGVALMAYALIGLTGFRLSVSARHEGWLSPLTGAITGLITGATGIFVLPAVPYIQALGFEKDELIQALGLSFLVSTVALGFGLASGGTFATPIAGVSVLALAPTLLGMILGQRLRGRIRAAVFSMWFFIGLGGLGLHLALRSVV